MNDDNRTLYDLVRNAIDCQDGVNLSGIVHSFSRDIARLRQLTDTLPSFSTDKLNWHPMCVLYSSKIASLTHSEVGSQFSAAYQWCRTVYDMGAEASTSPLPE